MPPSAWPNGKSFAFTIFDDPDSQILACSQAVYGLLADLGFLTTKGVWPLPADPHLASDHGETCGNPIYAAWLQELQQKGFEIGYHNATSHTSAREATKHGIDRFRELFGADPMTMANHYHSQEGIYWGPNRLSGWRRHVYNLVTLGRNNSNLYGHFPESPYFWGDYCRQHIRYVRNFVFPGINTLQACPFMPYHDPQRPFVNYWYAASEGSNVNSFFQCLGESSQDQLEAQGGACIMYVHFGHGFFDPSSGLNPRFRSLMQRLSLRNGWFVPVNELLDYLRQKQGEHALSNGERASMESRWLMHKIRYGTS